MMLGPFAPALVASLSKRIQLPPLVVGGGPTSPDTSMVPAISRTIWNPGVQGGIPNRTTVYITLNASSYGNGASDATSAIQAAINACPAGQVVALSAGTFKIGSPPLVLNKNNVTLRGSGETATTLQVSNGANAPVIIIGPQWWPSEVGSTNLTSNAVKGAYSVTVASTANMSVGQLVLIDQTTNSSITRWSDDSPLGSDARGWFSRTDRSVCQMMEIASIVGTTVTFTTPFHIDFATAYTAQLTRFSDAAVKGSGIEDMRLSGGEGGDSGGNAYFKLANGCWARNIDSYNSLGSSVHLYNSLHCTVRDSYVHETKSPAPGGGGYGLDISRGSADNLIENCIFWNFNKVMVMRASGGGNVIGYNYFEDGYINYSMGWMETGANASHMTTPHMELFEGNQAFNIGSDARWGNAYGITFFRNHSTGIRRNVGGIGLTDGGNRVLADISAYHKYYTFIGNVLGYQGMSPSPAGSSFTYQDDPPSYAQDPVPIWRLGHGDPTGTSDNYDSSVASTLLREGNYDYATNSVHWDSTAQALPESMYLSGKPSFFGANSWPWIDPLGLTDAARIKTLPARARFDALHGL